MDLPSIKTDVFDRLENAAGLPPIYYQNADDPNAAPPADDHLQPFVLPADTATLGLNDLSQLQGIVQVNVFVQKGKGQLAGPRIAQDVLDLFPRNTELPSCRFDTEGSIAPAFFDGGFEVTPVTLPYQQLNV